MSNDDEDLSVTRYEGRPGSLVMYRMGGQMYPLKHNGRCKVCNSPHRIQIEEEMISGHGPAFILKHLTGDHNLNIDNIRKHFDNGHLPSAVSVVRDLIDDRARERGEAYESGRATMVDHVSFLRTTMTKSFERMAKGEIKVSLDHGLAAAQALAALGYSESGIDEAMMVQAFMHYFDNMMRFTTPEVFESIMRANDSDPFLKAIQAQWEKQNAPTPTAIESSDDEIYDAEVVP